MTTQHAGTITFYNETGQITRTVTGDDVQRLERRLEIADAIMRSQPVGIPPRLVEAWEAGR